MSYDDDTSEDHLAPAVLPLVQAFYAGLDQETDHARLLTPAEEIALSQVITGSDPDHPTPPDLRDPAVQEAIHTLTLHNMRLVIDIASHMSRKGHSLPLEDLISVGWIGCYRGACKYDWRRGFRASTYLTAWIRQAIGRANIDHAEMIRLPVYQHGVKYHVSLVYRSYFETHGRYPSDAEVVLLLRQRYRTLSEASVREVTANLLPLSLDEPLEEDTDVTRGEAIIDPATDGSLTGDTIATEALVAELLDSAQLTARERFVIEMRFGLADGTPKTLAQVAQRLRLTRERVRQNEAKALRKLRLAAQGSEKAA